MQKFPSKFQTLSRSAFNSSRFLNNSVFDKTSLFHHLLLLLGKRLLKREVLFVCFSRIAQWNVSIEKADPIKLFPFLFLFPFPLTLPFSSFPSFSCTSIKCAINYLRNRKASKIVADSSPLNFSDEKPKRVNRLNHLHQRTFSQAVLFLTGTRWGENSFQGAVEYLLKIKSRLCAASPIFYCSYFSSHLHRLFLLDETSSLFASLLPRNRVITGSLSLM